MNPHVSTLCLLWMSAVRITGFTAGLSEQEPIASWGHVEGLSTGAAAAYLSKNTGRIQNRWDLLLLTDLWGRTRR